MATFKKRIVIKGLNSYIDPPEWQRCGTIIFYLSKLVLEFEEKTKKEFALRVIKCGIHTAKCEIECPDRKEYDTVKLAFLCQHGAYFDWRG